MDNQILFDELLKQAGLTGDDLLPDDHDALVRAHEEKDRRLYEATERHMRERRDIEKDFWRDVEQLFADVRERKAKAVKS